MTERRVLLRAWGRGPRSQVRPHRTPRRQARGRGPRLLRSSAPGRHRPVRAGSHGVERGRGAPGAGMAPAGVAPSGRGPPGVRAPAPRPSARHRRRCQGRVARAGSWSPWSPPSSAAPPARASPRLSVPGTGTTRPRRCKWEKRRRAPRSAGGAQIPTIVKSVLPEVVSIDAKGPGTGSSGVFGGPVEDQGTGMII